MCRTGFDTQANVTLWLCGASARRDVTVVTQSLWVDDDKRAVIDLLHGMAVSVTKTTELSGAQLD